MSEFQKLAVATRIVPPGAGFFHLAREWEQKRELLLVQIDDLPGLVAAHNNRDRWPHPNRPDITQFDARPTLRLAAGCESIAGTVYAMAEIAASFSNKLTNGELPSSFNKLRRKLEEHPSWKPDLAIALGDLQWYRKVREFRTEWAHHSTLFIGGTSPETLSLVVGAERRPSDRIEFPNRTICSVTEFAEWAGGALLTLDAFAAYLLPRYIIPRFNMEEKVIAPVIDEHGLPRMTSDHRFEVREITVGELLRSQGII